MWLSVSPARPPTHQLTRTATALRLSLPHRDAYIVLTLWWTAVCTSRAKVWRAERNFWMSATNMAVYWCLLRHLKLRRLVQEQAVKVGTQGAAQQKKGE